MSMKMEMKTKLIILGILLFFVLAILSGFHILWPALDPISADMIKIFACGAGCGLLAGIWLGWRLAKEIGKYE